MIFNISNIPDELKKGGEIAISFLEKDTPCINQIEISGLKCEKGLSVKLENNKAQISYSKNCEFFRGLGIIREWIFENKTSAKENEIPVYEHLTYMADCSRNGVCNIEYTKNLIIKLALMGYDRVMLYTEDTYEVEGFPYFGYLRGRYTKEELKEIDDFAYNLGVEMVPCIQTLAHLNAIFRWQDFQKFRDNGDILLCGSDDTYELIEAMIKTWSETFRSRYINIGMDEAAMIGRGAYIKKFGYEDRIDIMQKHLNRVLKICEKYGYTCMMWSDMFFKMISGGGYYGKDITITDEDKAKIPSNVELIYWDYYARNEETYEYMMKNHKLMSDKVGFAGGAWKWSGYAPLLNHSMLVSKIALKKCTQHGIKNVIVTGWSDDGNEASQSSVLPVLSLYAEYCYTQNDSDDFIAKRLKTCTNADFADFMKLDLPNLTPDNPSPGRLSACPEKYLLYQDPLVGIYDLHITKGFNNYYADTAKTLHNICKKGGEYSYLFDTLACLCDILSKKSELGVQAKYAYDNGDKQALANLSQACLDIIPYVDTFKKALKTQWYHENKSFGFEVLDIRLGGIKSRLESCSERLSDYAEGKISSLEELEINRLPVQKDGDGNIISPVSDASWQEMASASVLVF